MSRAARAEVMRHIPSGCRVVAGPGCGTPSTLLRTLAAEGEARGGFELWSGLLLGEVPLEAMRSGALRYHTWHVTAETRDLIAEGRAAFHPLRASDVPDVLERRQVSVALLRVSPPDRHGFVSLGTSVSYPAPMLRRVRTVIGEVDDEMPTTSGRSLVHRDTFAALVPSETPTPLYTARSPGSVARRIADHIVPLLPERPALQLGIGEIPEAVTSLLAGGGLGLVRCIGMATDAMVSLFDAGVLDIHRTVPDPAVAAIELMGTRTLLDRADRNPAIGVYPVNEYGDPRSLAQIDRFVSINSAVEIDLLGQVNAEWASGRQLSGLGGSLDFSEAAHFSRGGLRILALPSTVGNRSRISARLSAGTPVSLTRHSVDFVVTEHGVADLRGTSTHERIEALIAIADPAHQADLLAHSSIAEGFQEPGP